MSFLHKFLTHSKFISIFLLLTLLPMGTIMFLSYQNARNSLVNASLAQVNVNTANLSREINTLIAQFSSDLLTLSYTLPIQTIIRMREQPSQNLDDRAYEESTEQLAHIFITIVESKQVYQQLSYLSETGDEIVRVDYQNGQGHITASTELKNQAKQDYFINAQQIVVGKVTISDIMLKRENDQIVVPHNPVICLSTPIYNSEGQFRGVVMMYVHAKALANVLNTNGTSYLANTEGFYLSHPSKTFGSDLGKKPQLWYDFTNIYRRLSIYDEETQLTFDEERGEVVAMRRIHFDTNQPHRYWILISTLP